MLIPEMVLDKAYGAAVLPVYHRAVGFVMRVNALPCELDVRRVHRHLRLLRVDAPVLRDLRRAATGECHLPNCPRVHGLEHGCDHDG